VDPVAPEALIGRGLSQSPLAVVVFGTDLRIVWANEAAGRAGDGMPAAGWRGRRVGEVLPGLDTGLIEQSLRRVLASGDPVDGLQVSSRAGGDPGGERVWTCVQFRIDGPGGEATGVAHVMRDDTERAQDHYRLALADEAGARIGTTLDITRTAEELLDVAVPRLADACAVDLLTTVIEGDQLTRQARGEKMRLRRVSLRWPDAPADYVRSTWTETDPAKAYQKRLTAGQPSYLPAFGAMTEEQVRQLDSGTGLDRMAAARAGGAHSLIILPLIARGVIIGLTVFYRLGGSEPFTPADLSLAADLVSRAALSLDNARLYTRERATALALQRGLLPRQIPGIPGLDLAYRYVPAETAAEIGGDWFDVIGLPHGRCALIVGDVTGHDMRAASLMGQLRTATHTLATLDLTPSEILTRLDQITADSTDSETTATCIYAVHNPATGTGDIARAGHPLPAVVGPGGSASFLQLPPGLPLGTGLGDSQYQSTRLHVPRGSTLVLYTDGLIESRAADISTGMAQLARTLTATATLPVTDACDALLAALAPSPADDIAILMARTG
jgi:hypothetical protein